METEAEYILGTDAEELERLLQQHTVWAAQARALWARAGIGAGSEVLDLGSGPGYTTFELADVVGETGRVVARDESPRFVAHLAAEAERRGLSQVEVSQGTVESLELERGDLDGAYARWLFCWLEDPGLALARVARTLKPGGALVIQDYLDWGAMTMVPPSGAFDAGVAACMRSWDEGIGEINVCRFLPALTAEHGFTVEHFEPVARLGAVGSPEWQWVEGFFSSYLPRLVERGLLTGAGLEAWRRDWRERAAAGGSWLHTPTVADLVLRKTDR